MTPALLIALLSIRCGDEARLIRLREHDGHDARTTARVCRQFAAKTNAVAKGGV